MLGLRLGIGLRRHRRVGDSTSMILVYEIPAPSTPIQLAIQANSTWFSAEQEVVIDWGDGSAENVSATSAHTGYIGHTYTAARTYTIKISGSMTMYGRGGLDNLSGQTLLTRVDSFGKLGITSFWRAFHKCSGLVSVPKTLPSSILNISQMFRSCTNAAFNPDVSNWDVSSVRNMNSLFYFTNGDTFNPDFSNWDVSGVSDMVLMFYSCNRDVFKGVGIKNWKLRGSGVSMTSFMLDANVQPAEWLDEILLAWAALIDDTTNPLPPNVTITFPSNQPYNGSVSGIALAALANHGWVISTLVDAEA